MVLVSSSVKVCTADRFDRRADGNAEGFDLVIIVVDDVSVRYSSATVGRIELRALNLTFVGHAAYFTSQQGRSVARSSVQQVSAVCTKDQRSNCSHYDLCKFGN